MGVDNQLLKEQLKIGVISYDESPPRGYGACERIAFEFARYCDQTGWETSLLAMSFRDDINYGKIKLILTDDLYVEDNVDLLAGFNLIFAFHPGACFQLIRKAIESNATNAYFGIDISWPELIPFKMGFELPKHRVLCYTLCNRVAAIYLKENRPFCTIPLILYPDELPTLQEFRLAKRNNSILWMANADPGRHKDLEAALEFAEKVSCELIVADGGTYNRERIFPKFVRRIENVYGNEKRDLFLSSKAFLYTHPKGGNEAGGTAILEALYSGLPVYALNFSPGSPADTYIINGYNGYCTDSMDELTRAYDQIDQIDRQVVWNYGRSLFNPAVNCERRLFELLKFAKYIS